MPTQTPDQLIKAGPSANQKPVSRAAATPFQPIKEEATLTPAATEEPEVTPAEGAQGTPPAGDDVNINDILKEFEQVKPNALIDKEDGVKSADKKKVKEDDEDDEAAVTTEDEAEVVPPTATEEAEAEEEAAEEGGEAEAEAEEEVVPPTARTKADATAEVKIPEKIGKQMSKPAKEWVTAQLKKQAALAAELEEAQAEGAQGKGQGWYEHPNAFVLTEEFQQSSKNINETNAVLRHWQEQLVLIKNGDDFTDLGYNDQTGQIFAKPQKMKGDARADVYVTTRIQQAQQALAQEQQKMQQLQVDHQATHKAIPGMLNKLEERYFPQYVNGITSKYPKVTEFVKAASDHLKLLKQQHNPLTPFVLKLYAACVEMKLSQPAASKTSTAGGAKAVKRQVTSGSQAQAGPTQDNINAGGAVSRKPSNPDDVPFNASEWPGMR